MKFVWTTSLVGEPTLINLAHVELMYDESNAKLKEDHAVIVLSSGNTFEVVETTLDLLQHV